MAHAIVPPAEIVSIPALFSRSLIAYTASRSVHMSRALKAAIVSYSGLCASLPSHAQMPPQPRGHE